MDELGVMSRAQAEKRVFFVSAKECLLQRLAESRGPGALRQYPNTVTAAPLAGQSCGHSQTHKARGAMEIRLLYCSVKSLEL